MLLGAIPARSISLVAVPVLLTVSPAIVPLKFVSTGLLGPPVKSVRSRVPDGALNVMVFAPTVLSSCKVVPAAIFSAWVRPPRFGCRDCRR